MSSPPPKVVLVTNIPTPYRIPLFNELNRQLAERGWAFEVVFAASGYARRKWKISLDDCRFAYSVLPRGFMRRIFRRDGLFFYPGLGRLLTREIPAVVMTGGFGVATIKLWVRSYCSNVPYVIWSGAILRPGERDTILARWLRRRLVARARGCVAYGSRARDYLVALGADPGRVYVGINTVDTDFFSREAERFQAANPAMRDERGILYIGDLTKGKRLDLVLHALGKLHKRGVSFTFRIVGAGPEENSLRQLARSSGIENQVMFEGYRQRPEIPGYLARSACFVFPSEHDVWGLVLVEAMSTGTLVLSSVKAGATADLIQEGTNGYALDFEDVDAVAERIQWVLEHPVEASEMGSKARSFIQEHVSLAKSAAGFVAAAIALAPGQRGRH